LGFVLVAGSAAAGGGTAGSAAAGGGAASVSAGSARALPVQVDSRISTMIAVRDMRVTSKIALAFNPQDSRTYDQREIRWTAYGDTGTKSRPWRTKFHPSQ
jgi:hypothetical protein